MGKSVANFVQAEALRELGYQVVAAASAAEALSLIDQGERPALLFTDMVMPDMNGRQLAELALQRLPGLRVLFTSGYVRETGEGAAEFGARFLPKPFTLEQLAAKVRSVLDAR